MNHPAFNEAAAKLRACGFEVFSPAEHDVAMGFDPATATQEQMDNFDIRAALKADLSWIADNADMVVTLPGSSRSLGVAAEVALAEAIGIPVMTLSAALYVFDGDEILV